MADMQRLSGEDFSEHVAPPPLPLLAVALLWSAIFHVGLMYLLAEWVQAKIPATLPVLQVMLSSHAPDEPPVAEISPSAPVVEALSALESYWRDGRQNLPMAPTMLQKLRQPDDGGRSEAEAQVYYYKSSELEVQPQPLTQVNPALAATAREKHVEGSVRLLLLIDERGRVQHVEVVESTPPGVFDEAAIAAFGALEFTPGERGGVAVKSRMLIKTDFRMGDM